MVGAGRVVAAVAGAVCVGAMCPLGACGTAQSVVRVGGQPLAVLVNGAGDEVGEGGVFVKVGFAAAVWIDDAC